MESLRYETVALKFQAQVTNCNKNNNNNDYDEHIRLAANFTDCCSIAVSVSFGQEEKRNTLNLSPDISVCMAIIQWIG